MSTRTSTDAATPGRGPFDDVVKAELVRHLYRQSGHALFGSVFIGCFLTYVLWNSVARGELLAWLSALLVVCMLRFASVKVIGRDCVLIRGKQLVGIRVFPVLRPGATAYLRCAYRRHPGLDRRFVHTPRILSTRILGLRRTNHGWIYRGTALAW